MFLSTQLRAIQDHCLNGTARQKPKVGAGGKRQTVYKWTIVPIKLVFEDESILSRCIDYILVKRNIVT